MTEYVVEHPQGDPRLTREEARSLTEEIKADASALWVKLLDAYRDGAHKALGYKSWAAYCHAEFEMGRSASYRILDSARVFEQLHPGKHRDDGPVPNLGTGLPRNESVARELRAPALKKDPAKVEEVWTEAVRQHGLQATAAQVRATVDDVLGRKREESPAAPEPFEPEPWVRHLEKFMGELERVLDDARTGRPDRLGHAAAALAWAPQVLRELERIAEENHEESF